MKKIVLSILFLALIGGSLWAGGGQESPQVTSAETQEKPVKILMLEVNKSGWEADDNEKVRQHMIEQSGVDFEVINTKDAEELARKINLALAAQEDVDVIHVTYANAWLWDMVARGALQPINDVLESDGPNLLKHFDENIWPAVTDANGDIWAIPRRQGNMGNMMPIRRDWRLEVGMKDPPGTLAEFEEYLYKVKAAKPDAWPMVVRGYAGLERTLGYIITGESLAYGANWIDDQGRVMPGVMHPKYKDYIATLAKWHKDGILYPEAYTLKKNQFNDLIIADKVGAYAGWYSDIIRPWDKLKANNPQAHYEYPFIELENGKPYMVPRRPPGTPGMGIVQYSPNAKWAIRLFDWTLRDPSNYVTTRAGVPGLHWDWVDESGMVMKDMKEKDAAIYRGAYSITMDSAKYRTTLDGSGGFVRDKYAEVQNLMGDNGYIWAADWFVAYDWRGTPVEVSLSDANTMMEEQITKVIIGQRPVSDWDDIIAQYRKMHGDAYTETATAQYKAYEK